MVLAHEAFRTWSHTALEDRIHVLRALYHRFGQEKENLSQSIAREMGMPIKLAREEVLAGLNYYLWYLDHAEQYLSPEVTFEDQNQMHTLYYEPR